MERVQRAVERTVERFVARHGLWTAGAVLVVAVSGGADSLCLLGTLLALVASRSPIAPAEILVAHLNHGLRGEQGAADARWVADFAARAGLRCVVEETATRDYAQTHHYSLEDAARRARYAFLRRVAHVYEADRICVGHTRDDQVETLVMNWLRGSGLRGLSGMAPRKRDVARPLLEVSHADTLAYCQARGWQPQEDATNSDLAYRRNRVRHELLPFLERYNPHLRQTLTRNAALLRDDDDYVEHQTEAVWPGVIREADATRIAFHLDTLRAEPKALRHRLLASAAHQLAGYDTGLEASHLLALDAVLDQANPTGAVLHLPARLRARLEYDTLVLECTGSHPTVEPYTTGDEHLLSIPGTVDLSAMGWRVRVWHSELPPGLESEVTSASLNVPAITGAGAAYDVGQAELRVYVDADAAGDALIVRGWRPGDRFQPLGMRVNKKVQDVFSDAKVPRLQRHRLPLVLGREHLIWLGGVRIDDRVRLTPNTRRILVLQMEPLAPTGEK